MSAPAADWVLSEQRVASGTVPRFELESWREWGIRAGITGREGEFDLGLFANGRAGTVLGNWLQFDASQQPGFPTIVAARQVHGTRVAHHRSGAGWVIQEGVDGHLTPQKGILLTITVADCIPVYLAHPPSGTLALLHAGWRGIAGGILEGGIGSLCDVAGCNGAELIMHCGVGVCGDCYEVGSEVVQRLTGRSVAGKEYVDLRALLCKRAAGAGLTRVTVSRWCSAHDRSMFFSHRRSNGGEGRMLAYLGTPDFME